MVDLIVSPLLLPRDLLVVPKRNLMAPARQNASHQTLKPSLTHPSSTGLLNMSSLQQPWTHSRWLINSLHANSAQHSEHPAEQKVDFMFQVVTHCGRMGRDAILGVRTSI